MRILTNEQFKCCIMNQLDVDVWFQNKLELTSKIIAFDSQKIKFSEGFYLRERVEIRVKGRLLRIIT